MAEAAVEDSATNRFFCHKCSIEITRVLEDYTCPTCRGGFIEELDSANSSSNEPSDIHSDDEMDDIFSDVQNPFGQYFFGRDGRDGSRENQDRDSGNPDGGSSEGDGLGRRYRNGTNLNFNMRPSIVALIISLISSNRARNNHISYQNQYGRYEASLISILQIIEDFNSLLGLDQFRGGNIFGRYSNSIEHTIQEFLINMAGVGLVPMGPGGRGNEPVFFLGNPGDYAWGRGGLDAIVTQLLNQIDGTGPPPLDKEKIREIPVTVIEQEQVDSNLQCSVCWDDFKVGEPVRKLECEHFYHESCIVPWLELHGTCPICRKSLLTDQEDKPSANTGSSSGRPNLAMLRTAVRNRNSTNLIPSTNLRASTNMRTSTNWRASANSRTSSSLENISESSSTNSSNGRHPPSDFHMDLEFDEP